MSKPGDVTQPRVIKYGDEYIIAREKDTSFEEDGRPVFQITAECLQLDGTWQAKPHTFPLHREVQP